MLKSFHALPTEARAREMTDADYLYCALHLLLDAEGELDRLCPACRAGVQREGCPACGAPRTQCGENEAFDMARFERLKGGEEA